MISFGFWLGVLMIIAWTTKEPTDPVAQQRYFERLGDHLMMPLFGSLAGFAIFFIGYNCGRGFICDACGNGVENHAKLCPTCKAKLC